MLVFKKSIAKGMLSEQNYFYLTDRFGLKFLLT